jgi:predicted nucleic acid-binding protein
VLEPGSDEVQALMAGAEAWFTCRIAFVETARAVGLVAGAAAVRRFASEWSAFGVVELDQSLVERAAALSARRRLRSLDALHLASALLLPSDELVVATWDQRLHAAAVAEARSVVPAALA